MSYMTLITNGIFLKCSYHTLFNVCIAKRLLRTTGLSKSSMEIVIHIERL